VGPVLNEMGDLVTQNMKEAVRMPPSPQRLVTRLAFRNVRTKRLAEVWSKEDTALEST